MSGFLEIALSCLARGWYVFPCVPGDKNPIIAKKDGGHGWHDATLDEAQIRAWWTKWPNANPAIACNPTKISVMDCDHGLASYEDFIAWRDRNSIPATYTVRTGRRDDYGVQMYFDGPLPGVGLWQLDGCSGQIKSLDGYVMAAGCIHPDSKERYAVIVDAPLAPVPDVVRNLKTFTLPVKQTGPMDKIPEGAGRHAALTSVAGVFRNRGFDEEAIHAQLIPANGSMCEVPISDEDLQHIAESVCRYPVPEPVGEVVIGGEPAAPEPPKDWREYYHTTKEHDNVGPPRFLIEGFLPEQAIMGIGAFVGQKKTLAALNIVFSLCSGEPLFGKYKVTRKPARVLYLGPENGLISFSDRVNRIGLRDYLCKSFFYATMSMQEKRPLTALMSDEIQDAVVVVDTAIRFTDGNENDAAMMKEFADQAFSLIKNKAASVIMLHHSPKSMTKANELTLENSFRGTGELSAFLSVALAMRTQDMDNEYESASLFRFVKQRDFEPRPSAFEVKTSRETCRMSFIEGSDGAVVMLGNTANKDGKDDVAVVLLRENPQLSNVKMAQMLKAAGIKRSKEWTRLKRGELGLGGLKTGSSL